MERGHSRKNDDALAKFCQNFIDIMQKIRANFSNFDKLLDVRDWIREAHYYAEQARNEGINIIKSGGTVSRKGGNNRAAIPSATIDDIYRFYYERTEMVQYYSDRLSTLRGQAIPIPYGGGLAGHEGGKHDGHTQSQHTPKYINELEYRLKSEDKEVVSGFFSEEIANSAIARTLEVNKDEILEWLENPVKQKTFSHDFGRERIGLVLIKGKQESIKGSKVKVLLVYDPDSTSKYRIKTSYIDP
jgi:hypothetical protein